MKWKDRITFVIAVVAFVLSLWNFYSTSIRQMDDVSIIISSVPSLRRVDADKMITRKKLSTIALLNSGTRPATILSVDVLFIQSPRSPEEECSGDHSSLRIRFETDFEPLVLKEKETVVKTIKITGYQGPKGYAEQTGDDFTVTIRGEYRKERTVPVAICYAVHLATPSVSSRLQVVPVTKTVVSEIGLFISDDYGEDLRPKELIKNREFRFAL